MINDLISRSALKEALHNEIGDHALSKAIDRVIDNAPTVEECAGHTIDYAMGWKACIEWIKKGGAE